MLPCILVKVGMLAVFVALFLVAVWRLAMRLLPEPLSPDSHHVRVRRMQAVGVTTLFGLLWVVVVALVLEARV